MAFTTSGQETEWDYSYSPGAHTGRPWNGADLLLQPWSLHGAICIRKQTKEVVHNIQQIQQMTRLDDLQLAFQKHQADNEQLYYLENTLKYSETNL